MTKLLLIITFLVLSGCISSNKQVYYERVMLEQVARLATIKPVPPFNAPAYVLSTDDSIVVTNFDNVHELYLAIYKNHYSQFPDFLFDALNHRIKLNTNLRPFNVYYEQKFMLDSVISSFYNKESIDGLINKYVVPDNNGYILKRTPLSINQVNTISFYFFLNQYLRQDDCYNPSIGYYKLSFVLQHVGEF